MGMRATLEGLCALRYKRFKLVDQRSVMVLTLNQEFYTRMYTRAWSKVERFAPSLGRVRRIRSAVCRHHDYTFPVGSTGPFGADLEGVWIDAERAAETLVFHRRDYFASSFAQPYGFWCDWHAAQADRFLGTAHRRDLRPSTLLTPNPLVSAPPA